MAKSSTYWDKRALRRLDEAEKTSEVYINRIKKIYDKAYRDVNREIASVYRNYSKDTGVDVDKLKELLTRSETAKTWEQMKRQGLDKYVKDNYKARISRLEQVQAQIYAKAKLIYPKEELEQKMCYEGVINNSYYKTVYDTQMGTGYNFTFSKIDKNMVDALLNERWSGKNYSQRIWGNTDILAESLSEVIGGSLLSGQSIAKTSRQVRERFNVSKYYAERLVRTETNHFNNTADAMAYEDMGVDMYVFVATLDDRTSTKCQNMDGKKFAYKDKEEGVNFPPLHPNCRSKTRGYIDEEIEKTIKRRARNLETGKTEIIDNISYKEWAEKNGLVKKQPVKKKVIEKQNKFVPLTDKQKQAVEHYVSGEGMWINQYLRGNGDFGELTDLETDFLNELRGATNNELGKPMTLYRSVDANSIFGNISDLDYDNLKSRLVYNDKQALVVNSTDKYINNIVGKEFTEKGFMSTSKSLDLTKEFGDFTGANKPIILELETPANIKGVDVGKELPKLEEIMEQQEVLLQDNIRYSITNIEGKDGNIYVKAKILGQGDKVAKTVAQTTAKPVLTTNDLPEPLIMTRKEVKNAQLLVDFINNSKNADPKVVKAYSLMGKIKNNGFKLSHGKNHSISYRKSYSGDISDFKLTIPNIKNKDDIANINTVLHENMHFIDFMSSDKGSRKLYSSLNSQSLVDTVLKTPAKPSEEISNVFIDFNKGLNKIKDEMRLKYNPQFDLLTNNYKAGKLTYGDYNKEWKRVKALRDDELNSLQRGYMGGGINSLQDIYDALSKGRYRDAGVVTYGHGSKYYRTTENVVTEIVANYGALSIHRPDLIKMLKADKPELVNELDKLMDTIINKYGG